MPHTSWLLLGVLAVWVALTVWRLLGLKLMHRIEAAYVAHYLERAQHPQRTPAAVRWDFAQDALVEAPEAATQPPDDSESVHARAIRDNRGRLPLRAYGLLLARIPTGIFHGGFGAVMMGIWLVGRTA